jgi:hypothetical protein
MASHCVDQLLFEVDFATDELAFDEHERTAAFARARLPRILDEVLEAHTHEAEVWRLDALEVDLGPVNPDELEAEWERRLRERLAEALQEQRLRAEGVAARREWLAREAAAEAAAPTVAQPDDAASLPGLSTDALHAEPARARATQAATGSSPTDDIDTHPGEPQAPLPAHDAQREVLLHYLRHGQLPWNAASAGVSSAALDGVFADLLRHEPEPLLAGWRDARLAPLLTRRAARQFSAATLARLAAALARHVAPPASTWGRDASAWVEGFSRLWTQSELPGTPAASTLWEGLLSALTRPLQTEAQAADPSEPLRSMVTALAPAAAEQAAIWRALQAVARRAVDGSPPAPTATLEADLVRACLAARLPALGRTGPALDDAESPPGSRADEQARLLQRLRAWFDPQGAAPGDAAMADPAHGIEAPWHALLQAERSWARQTLLQLGRTATARRRMAQTLPPATLHALLALWLAPTEQELLQTLVPSDAFWGPPPAALEASARWEMTLSYVLLHPAPTLFNGVEYLDAMLRERSERENRPLPALRRAIVSAWRNSARAQGDTSPSLATVQQWLRRHHLALDADHEARQARLARRVELAAALSQGTLATVEEAWFLALNDDAAWLQSQVRAAGRHARLRRRMAREWTAVARGQLIGLWLPAAERAAVVAAVHNPALAPLAGDDRPPSAFLWEDLIEHLLRLTPGTFFNADAYIQGLHERLARQQGRLHGAANPAQAAPTARAAAPEHEATPSGPTPQALWRAMLDAALPQGHWVGVEAAWEQALTHDAAWLRQTLRRAGRSLPTRRRMAHSASPAVLQQVLCLFLGPSDAAFVREAVQAPLLAALSRPEGADRPAQQRRILEHTLAHLLLGTPERRFDRPSFMHALLQAEADERELPTVVLAREVLAPASPPLDSSAPSQVLREVAAEVLAQAPSVEAEVSETDEPRADARGTAALSGPASDAMRDTTSPPASITNTLSTGDEPEAGALHAAHPLQTLLDALQSGTGLPERLDAASLGLRPFVTSPNPARALRTAWLEALEQAPVSERLLRLTPAPALTTLLSWLRPREAPAVTHAIDALQTALLQAGTPLPREELGRHAWRFTLRELFQEGRRFEPAGFAARMAQHLTHTLRPPEPAHWLAAVAQALDPSVLSAPAIGQPPSTALPPARTPAPELRLMAQAVAAEARTPEPGLLWHPPGEDEAAPIESVYIRNAGLVIAGAYLGRLFQMLSFTDGNAFVDDTARERAVLLTQLVVTGQAAAPEPELALNKLLCGVPLNMPVAAAIEPTEHELNTIDGLLKAMIAHWKIIGTTSVAGLRETFLQREGQLVRDDEAWTLRVESKAFDMLLDHLPWGYQLLKFPWMERPLHVEWR